MDRTNRGKQEYEQAVRLQRANESQTTERVPPLTSEPSLISLGHQAGPSGSRRTSNVLVGATASSTQGVTTQGNGMPRLSSLLRSELGLGQGPNASQALSSRRPVGSASPQVLRAPEPGLPPWLQGSTRPVPVPEHLGSATNHNTLPVLLTRPAVLNGRHYAHPPRAQPLLGAANLSTSAPVHSPFSAAPKLNEIEPAADEPGPSPNSRAISIPSPRSGRPRTYRVVSGPSGSKANLLAGSSGEHITVVLEGDETSDDGLGGAAQPGAARSFSQSLQQSFFGLFRSRGSTPLTTPDSSVHGPSASALPHASAAGRAALAAALDPPCLPSSSLSTSGLMRTPVLARPSAVLTRASGGLMKRSQSALTFDDAREAQGAGQSQRSGRQSYAGPSSTCNTPGSSHHGHHHHTHRHPGRDQLPLQPSLPDLALLASSLPASLGSWSMPRSSSITRSPSGPRLLSRQNSTSSGQQQQHLAPAAPPTYPICLICLEMLTPEDFESGEAISLQCNCKGDVALRHRRCAIEWSHHKGDILCDICKHPIANLPPIPDEVLAAREAARRRRQPSFNTNTEPNAADYMFDCIRVTWVTMIVCVLFFNLTVGHAFLAGLGAGIAFAAISSLLALCMRRRTAARAARAVPAGRHSGSGSGAGASGSGSSLTRPLLGQP